MISYDLPRSPHISGASRALSVEAFEALHELLSTPNLSLKVLRLANCQVPTAPPHMTPRPPPDLPASPSP